MEQYIAQLRDSQGWISTPSIHPNWRLPFLRYLFGESVVVVAMTKGTKAMRFCGELDQYPARMQDPEYLRLLGTDEVDLAVLNGPANGNLVTLDLDTSEAVREWQQYFERCACTLPGCVAGLSARGMKYFFRIDGEYPARRVDLGGKDRKVGDFLGGSVTKVCGMHPEGVPYKIWFRNSVPTVKLEELPWPPSFKTLIEPKSFECYQKTQRGVALNHWDIARAIATENPVFFDTSVGRFFNWSKGGVFECVDDKLIYEMISDFIERLAKDHQVSQLRLRRTRSELESIRLAFASIAQRPILEESKLRRRSHFAAANGDLRIQDGQLFEPSPHNAMTSRSHVMFSSHTKCPRFNSWLNDMFPKTGDVRVIHLAFSQCLMGSNVGKKILAIHGKGDTGKSTLIRVMQRLLGHQMFAELRTSHLDGRFELAAYRGKAVLLANDASDNFLMTSGAQKLKALTGGDRCLVELKGSSDADYVDGNFNVVLVSNSLLRIATHQDASAFLSRMVIVEARPFKGPRIRDFDEMLLREEGSGILNWLLEGVRELLASSDPAKLFDVQPHRSQDVIKAFDVGGRVAEFVSRNIEERAGVPDVSNAEIYERYRAWCDGLGIDEFDELSPETFGRHLARAMKQVFDNAVVKCNSMHDGKRRQRGYRNIVFRLGM